MGNCQAADASAVVIQHRDGRLEKAYWSLPATQVMAANPGHYVASVLTCTPRPSSSSSSTSHHQRRKSVAYLKLLRPDDTLVVGHVYRLISFEEVLREFASKRHVRLSRLLDKQQEEKARSSTVKGDDRYRETAHSEGVLAKRKEHKVEVEVDKQLEEEVVPSTTICRNTPSGGATRHGQWKPALESIAEVGENK